MNKVISFGEVLVDLLSSRIAGEQQEQESFMRFPGGAPANVAVGIAKLGGRSYFAGKVGADMFGDFLWDALKAEGVVTDYLQQTPSAKTALAFVSLDRSGERRFVFYRDGTADLQFKPADFRKEWFSGKGIFHFCSNTLTDPDITETTLTGVELAKTSNWLVSFDVNLRENLWPRGRDPLPHIWRCIEQAQVVKLSVEELAYLCRDLNENQVIDRISSHVSLLVVTDAGGDIRYVANRCQGVISPPEVNVVDTTAAGDAFVGGLLYALAEAEVTPERLAASVGQVELERWLSFAAGCGAHAVTREGAFTSLPTHDDLEKFGIC